MKLSTLQFILDLLRKEADRRDKIAIAAMGKARDTPFGIGVSLYDLTSAADIANEALYEFAGSEWMAADEGEEVNHMRTKNIYPNLRAAMARCGKTIGQLAEDTGIHRECMSRKICGKTAFWLDEALAIAAAVGFEDDVRWLFQKEKA